MKFGFNVFVPLLMEGFQYMRALYVYIKIRFPERREEV